MKAVDGADSRPRAADPAVAAIKRRYYWLMASVAAVDFAITLIFVVTADAYAVLARNLVGAIILLVVANVVLARRNFHPISRFLDTGTDFAAIERRLTQLPLRSAAIVAALTLPLWAFRMAYPLLAVAPESAGPVPALLDAVAVVAVITFFYFTYTYFLISDYLATLGKFMFGRWGVNLGLFFGRFSLKLIVALLVTSILPMLLVLIDAFSYSGDRVREEILTDAICALFGISLSAIFVARSLNRPLAALDQCMAKVADGDLGTQLPVTSNDEVGKVTGGFNHMVAGLREREFIRETFGKYLSESVASQILRDRGRLAGEVRTATLMFIDIEGFTSLSERLTPQRTIALLNDYTSLVIDSVRRHGGVINNFIGDGVFASFNLPLDNADHARNAVLAAIDVASGIAGYNFGDGVNLAIRIGINTGLVVAGTVGSGDRLTYSILGDAVNVAHRVEELNKELGTRILMTDHTYRQAGDGLPVVPLGSRPVRGKRDAIVLYQINPDHPATS